MALVANNAVNHGAVGSFLRCFTLITGRFDLDSQSLFLLENLDAEGRSTYIEMILQNTEVRAQSSYEPTRQESEIGQKRKVTNKNRAFCYYSGELAVVFPPVFVFQKRIRSKPDIRRNSFKCQNTVGIQDIDLFTCLCFLFQDVAELANVDFDLWLKLVDRTGRKKVPVPTDTTTMNITVFSCKRYFGNTRNFVIPRVLF